MNRYVICKTLVFAGALISGAASAQSLPAQEHSDSPSCLTYDCAQMNIIKESLHHGDKAYAPAGDALLKSANSALQHPRYSVVDKTLMPASGDKHDYFSFGPYWWPNPDTSTGLPYIRKDGQINPSSKTGDTDSERLVQFADDVRVLSLAWFYSGEPQYAEKAQLLLNTWFLNKQTRMNPNLNYAQAIPGVVNGRGIGIIDTRVLIDVADSIELLQASGRLSPIEVKGYKQWYQNYTHWLLTSENGFEEANWYNNHGAWYDAQVTAFSLFTGDKAQAVQQIKIFELRHLASQVNNKGELTAELERTRSFHYSNFALAAYAKMGRYGELTGEKVWAFSLDDHSMQKAFSLIAKQVGKPASEWPYQDIKFSPTEATGPMLAAARAWNDPLFTEKAKILVQENPQDINRMMPGSILVK